MWFSSTPPASTSHYRSSVGLRSQRSKRSRGLRRGRSWLHNVFQYFSPQDLVVVCAALVVLYLITGDHAELVCDIFTSLPPAVFTYQLLTNRKATTVAYEAALCFWILHGTLIIFDHLLRKTVWYFLAKFILMAAVLSHVMTKCKADDEQEKSNDELEATNHLEAVFSQSSLSIMPDSAEVTAVRVKRINKRISRAMHGAGARRPPRVTPLHRLCSGRRSSASFGRFGSSRSISALKVTAAAAAGGNFGSLPYVFGDVANTTPRTQYFQSLSDKLTPLEKRFEQFEADVVKSMTVSKAVQTMSIDDVNESSEVVESSDTLKMSPPKVNDVDESTEQAIVDLSHSSASVEQSTFMTVKAAAKKMILNELREHLAARNGRFGAGDRMSIGSLSTAHKTIDLLEESLDFPSSCIVPGDLVINRREIMFTRPYDEVVTLKLANNSAHGNLLWEIKTNAADRVFVTPNRGVLPIDRMLKVYVNVRHPDDIGTPYEVLPTITADRVAIDYMFVAPDHGEFNTYLFNERGAEKRRKNLAISYRS